MFTNVSSPLHWNFSRDTIPEVLQEAPQFLLNNPIALQKKYLKLKNDLNMKTGKANLRAAVQTGQEDALEMLVDLFDWLDGLEPQPTTNAVPPCGTTHNDKVATAENCAPMGKTAAKETKRSAVRCSSHLHFVWGPNLIIIVNRP